MAVGAKDDALGSLFVSEGVATIFNQSVYAVFFCARWVVEVYYRRVGKPTSRAR